jgi:hypothetical protein
MLHATIENGYERLGIYKVFSEVSDEGSDMSAEATCKLLFKAGGQVLTSALLQLMG